VPFPGNRPYEHWDVCEIGWWRGYVKSEFYAIALGPDRREYDAGRSRSFLWRKAAPPPPEHDRARAAHEALVQKLVDSGWEPLGKANPWFAQRFRRHTTGLRVLSGEPVEGSADDESLLQP
jgi:hypothetical protein